MPSFSVFQYIFGYSNLFVLYFHCTTLASTLFFLPKARNENFKLFPGIPSFGWHLQRWGFTDSLPFWFEAWVEQVDLIGKSKVSKGNLRTVHESHLNSSSILFATLKCIFSLHACSCWTSKECFSVILETSSFKLHLYMSPSEVRKILTKKNLCDHEIWSYFSLKKAYIVPRDRLPPKHFWVSFEAKRCDGNLERWCIWGWRKNANIAI